MAENLINAWTPEFWASESLITLQNELVLARLVYRDFEDMIQKRGDTVNTRKPATFTARTKAIGASVVVDDASADNYAVVLDTHAYISFSVDDVTRATSLESLVEVHIRPAVQALAQRVDTDILAKMVLNFPHVVGTVGSAATIPGTLTSVNRKAHELKWPSGRSFVIGPTLEEIFLASTQFTSQDYVQGDALANAWLGQKWASNLYMDQNVETLTGAQANVTTGWVVNGAVAKGDSTITVDTGVGVMAAGGKITLGASPAADGSDAYAVTAATSTLLTISPTARKIYADNTVINIVNNNKATIYSAPFFQPSSMALVVRPLPLPENFGQCFVAKDPDSNLAIRAILGFDQDKLGLRVTLDMLYGVAPLDVDRGALFVY